MEYELAKKLKDTGFPFTWFDCIDEGKDNWTEYPDCEPSLSELIEACGKEFFGLISNDIPPEEYRPWGPQDRALYENINVKPYWVATAFVKKGEGIPREGLGNNPEEAVANLWLALNKK